MEDPEATTIAGHQCRPTTLAGVNAHRAQRGAEVTCPCGKTWRPTKRHHGPGNRVCGCGWALVREVAA